METLLLSIFLTVSIATLFNIVFKRLGISHIIGYIATGTIISYLFGFNGLGIESLSVIGEFGIVFLMFTIGLELSMERIKKMKEILITNGFLQVTLSVAVIFTLSTMVFGIDFNTSLIIALAFSLSSTAIVMTHLKKSKDILTPYGQISMGILIFQDLAVIPIMLLITFLSNDTLSLTEVLIKTALSAVFVVAFMLTLGARIVEMLLRYAVKAELEEVFLGAVFAIVMGSALLAHSVGFTFSLGAFIAGMIIAGTHYSDKVESDIASTKDLLLGAFFFGVGTKIDVVYFLQNIHIIIAVFVVAMVFKAAVIYAIIRRSSDKNTSAKSALALAQIGEFSFAVFAFAGSAELITPETASFLILVSVISMILTPFIVGNIYKLSSYFEKEFYEADVITPIGRQDHIIIAGFGTLGKIVAASLQSKNANFVIISDNLKHVLHARKLGYMAYFGHLNKIPVMESLMLKDARGIIITVMSEQTRRLICEAVLGFDPSANILVKIDNPDDRKRLRDLPELEFVDSSFEVANLLVSRVLKEPVPKTTK